MRNYDIIRFCLNSQIRKRILGVQNQLVQHVSLQEIDIQSQRLAENVLNRAFILLSNRIQSFFPLHNGFSNCLNGDLLLLVFDCLFEVL